MRVSQKLKLIVPELVLPYVRARNKKPLTQQAGELFFLFRKYKIFPYQYLRLALYKNIGDVKLAAFIPASIIQRARREWNHGSSIIVDDKVQFARLMESCEIPSPRTLCVIRRGHAIVDLAEHPLSKEDALRRISCSGGHAFVKKLSAAGGHGAFVLRGGEEWISAIPANGGTYIVQELLQQHPQLSRLNRDSVNTVRLDTFCLNGETSISAACLRVGRSGRVVDNYSSGGIVVAIDLETGWLTGYGRQKPSVSTNIFESHPDSGVTFSNVRIPFWEEIKTMVVEAAPRLKPLSSIGWDIGVTPAGPVVVEANANWEISTTQMVVGLGGTRLGQAALAMRRGRCHIPRDYTAAS